MQFPTKIILKVLARKREIGKKSISFHRLLCKITWLPKITAFLKKFFVCYPHKIIRDHRFTLLWCLFLSLWHPGLYSRTTPLRKAPLQEPSGVISPRPEMYPVEQVRLQISGKGWLVLYMKEKKVAAFPATIQLPAGTYRVKSLVGKKGDTLARIEDDISRKAVLRAKDTRTDGFFVALDNDYWEILYPYLRPGTPVCISR